MTIAATIRVPSEQPTIQAGIDASVDGDTVLVADGTYAGAGNKNLDYEGRAITIVSENGPYFTTIDCEGDGRGFYFRNAETSFSKLDGFTITNGHASLGGGIRCVHSSPTIKNCILWNDTPQEVYVESGYPVITFSDVQGGWEGEGNINRDPLFILKSWFGFDYGLRTSSPCIDSGDPPIEDEIYDRHPLCPDWYVNGARSDMGAFGGPGNIGWLE